MIKVLIAFAVSSLYLTSSMAQSDKTKQEMTDESHKVHMKCMEKTGKSMEECMKMKKDSTPKSEDAKKSQHKTH
jgi:major membrane immunogen (membrane-anchored lipoprotein)